MLIPSDQVVIQALDHEIRRTVLRLLQARAYSYSELMKLLNIPSGKLNYHLSQIAGFIKRNKETGQYESTVLGVKAIDLLDLLQQHLSDTELPFLCEAYVCQMSGREDDQLTRPSYLKGTIDAVKLIKRLFVLLEEREASHELPNFLSQIEAKASKKTTSLRENHPRKNPSSLIQGTSLRSFWQGVCDTVNHARMQLLMNKQNFPHFLSSMKKQAVELQKLTKRDLELEILPTSTEISEYLTEGINWLADCT